MNDKHNKSTFGKTFYCFFPILIYFGITILVQLIFQAVITVNILQQYPNLTYTDLTNKLPEITNKALEYLTAASSKLMLIIAILTIIVTAILFFRNEYKHFDKKYQNKIPLKGYAAAIALSIGFYMLVQIVFTISVSLFNLTDIMNEYNNNIGILFSDNVLIDILAVGIFVPICEELIFRGLVFNRMRGFMKESVAIIFSAILFGFMHFDPVQLSYALGLGLILSYSYSKFENILVPVIIHILFNLMNFVFMIDSISNLPVTKASSLIYYAICIILTYFGARTILKHSKPSLKI